MSSTSNQKPKRQTTKINFVPPVTVAKEAELGLALREKFHRGGTAIGFERARSLARRDELNPREIRRIYSYFARHEVDKKGKNFYNETRPSKGFIAWQLWGGEAGKEWVGKIRERIIMEVRRADPRADAKLKE